MVAQDGGVGPASNLIGAAGKISEPEQGGVASSSDQNQRRIGHSIKEDPIRLHMAIPISGPIPS